MKKLLLTLLLLVSVGIAAMAQETGTATFAVSGNSTERGVTGTNQASGITITDSQGTGSTAPYLNKTKAGNYTQHRFVSGNSITFSTDGTNEITKIEFKATSENYNVSSSTATCNNGTVGDGIITFSTPVVEAVVNVTANLRLTKIVVTYQSAASPSVCSTPKFNIENGASVYPGMTITVDKGNATSCQLLVNNNPVEGNTYTVPEDAVLGSKIELTANSTLEVEGGETLTASASIKVTVAEMPTESMFNFTTDPAYGMNSQTNSYESGTKTIEEGLVTITLSGSYRITTLSGNDIYKYCLRLHANQNSKGIGKMEISVPDDYYITKVTFGNYSTSANASVLNQAGSISNNVWTFGEKELSSVALQRGDSNPSFTTINVEYAKRKPEIVNGAEGIHTTVKQNQITGWMIVYYEFSIANYDNVEPEVEMVVYDGTEKVTEGITFSVYNPTPSAKAPNFAAAENKNFDSNLKATGEIFKDKNKSFTADLNVTVNGKTTSKTGLAVGEQVTTGIEDVTVDENAPAEYFTLQGVRVGEPQAGQLYIKRQGSKATKVFVK